MIQRGHTSVTQVKVVWSDMDTTLATWEDATPLKERFPHAPAWGQAASEERGNVSPDMQDKEEELVKGEDATTTKTKHDEDGASAQPRRQRS
jgi:hypothetical protein